MRNLEAFATDFSSCNRTAPSPYELVSTDKRVGLFGHSK